MSRVHGHTFPLPGRDTIYKYKYNVVNVLHKLGVHVQGPTSTIDDEYTGHPRACTVRCDVRTCNCNYAGHC